MFSKIFEKKKLSRLHKWDGYKTGDANDWTYEYTWEDMAEAEHQVLNTTRVIAKDKVFSKTINQIRSYFLKYPEKLLEDGHYKNEGLTVKEIRKRLKALKWSYYLRI